MMDQKTPRYIDANAMFADIENGINAMTKIGITVDGEWLWDKLLDAFENAPTISPDEIRGEAEWIKEETIMGTQYRCSNCDNADNKHTAIRGHYCWFCGAKMVRGGNDGKTDSRVLPQFDYNEYDVLK